MNRCTITMTVERLEGREQPAALATLAAGTLTITADDTGGRLDVFQDAGEIVVRSAGLEVGRFNAAAVTSLNVSGGAGDDVLRVDNALTQMLTLNGGGGRDKISAGGGLSTLAGDAGANMVVGGTALNTFPVGPGRDDIYKTNRGEDIALGPLAQFIKEQNLKPDLNTLGLPQATITAVEVDTILQRASAVSKTNDGIIAIVDRNGRILGVWIEDGVDPALLADKNRLIFAIDGAVAKARTGAFFGNNESPLTSRTIQNISQSTNTQREIESMPGVADPTLSGPGYVAPIGIKAHFPPNIPFTPQVDLFGIEHTNRDTMYSAGPDGIRGTADDEKLDRRFNTDAAFTTGMLYAPDSFGVESGLTDFVPGTTIPLSQPRGIATLPGGIPLYKRNEITDQQEVVGGIGVFFPGKTGFATEENSALDTTYDATKPDRSLEAEAIAFVAGGGLLNTDPEVNHSGVFTFNTDFGGGALPAGFGIPIIGKLRIDLVGITLDVIGPGGTKAGPQLVRNTALSAGFGSAMPSGGTIDVDIDAGNGKTRDGLAVSDGWIVQPHDGNGITAADVVQIVNQGLEQAKEVRAAIRLPIGERAKFVFAVADRDGNIVGLYRMADATVFSIDVAVAKARNVNYYADAAKLQPQDRLEGIAPGVAFTNRTFRYLANPRFPTGIDGSEFGPFSQLNDPGTNPANAQNAGTPVNANQFQSVFGYDSFHPGTNFRDKTNTKNQNGIVFFPGSAPIYKNGALIGGFGVSGDGVDQDDVTTGGGQTGFGVPATIGRADLVTYHGIRLPYQKFNRNPEG